jgi:hypothetical protein
MAERNLMADNDQASLARADMSGAAESAAINGAAPSVDRNQRLELREPQVVAQVVDGEVVAINLDSGCYYSLRDSAAVIWGLLAAGCSVEEVVADLQGRYLGAPETIDGETVRFAQELSHEGLLRQRATGATERAQHQSSGAAEAPVPFASPVLESFNDMEDLLLLDPVHDVGGEGWPHVMPIAGDGD